MSSNKIKYFFQSTVTHKGWDFTEFHIFIIIASYNYKLIIFFAKTFNKPFKDYIEGRRFNQNLRLSYLKSLKIDNAKKYDGKFRQKVDLITFRIIISSL